MIKLCKHLSTMWNWTDSRFVAGLNNILDRFLCKADFILSRHFTLLHSRFVKPPDWIWELFKKIILATGRDQETVKWEKRNFIPKQNTHDLFVGTLSIGIPSLVFVSPCWNLIAPKLWAGTQTPVWSFNCCMSKISYVYILSYSVSRYPGWIFCRKLGEPVSVGWNSPW